jgi:L-amino acid N-acyltransferase YncA
MTTEMTIRTAMPADAAAIAAIYNQGIAERIATFETEPRTAEQVATQLTEKGDRFPSIAVECEGRIIAFAGAGPYRSRPCYAGVAEHSVYVDPRARGRGAGKAALEALIASYEARGFWKLLSRIFPENKASLALHERCGFRTVGTYRRHAKLDGAWRDCVIVERLLGDAAR